MDQDLRVRISGWRFESARSHENMGCDPGSGWFPSPTSGVQLLGGLRARQAAHLVVRPVSYAGRAGFDPLACHDDPSGDSSGGCAAARISTGRADHLGVIAVLHTACAGFDSLARYPVPLAQWQVQSPDERTTEVRVLHGTRPHGVRSVMVAREFVNLVARVRFPPHTQHSRARPRRALWSRNPLVRMRGCRPR